MDERLRRLEHRSRASGDPADAGRLLLERCRAGALPRERLALAAHAGEPAAVAALGPPPGDLRAWALGLAAWGVDAVGRALVAAALLDLEGWEAAHAACEAALEREPFEAWLRRVGATTASAVAAAEAWLLCPCRTHARQALLEPDVSAPTAAGAALNFVAADLRPRADLDAGASPAALATAADRLGEVAAGAGEARLREAIAAELGGWALGGPDPLRGRLPLWARLPERWTDRWAVERPGELERFGGADLEVAPSGDRGLQAWLEARLP